jgi:flagellar biogenesis protein FliO
MSGKSYTTIIGMWGLLVLLCTLGSLGIWLVHGQAAEPQNAPPTTESTAPSGIPQERFLQNFISRSLVEAAPDNKGTTMLPARETTSPKEMLAVSKESLPAMPSLSSQLATTATTMLLALGAILGCLLGGAYLIRRFFLTQIPFGKRPNPLRVLARASITPKAAVALLEVPGKLLIVGVTGNTLVSLGEVPVESTVHPQPAPETKPLTFATTLEQSVQELEPPSQIPPQPIALTVPLAQEHAAKPAPEHEENAFLQLSAQIQRKLSKLKQL